MIPLSAKSGEEELLEVFNAVLVPPAKQKGERETAATSDRRICGPVRQPAADQRDCRPWPPLQGKAQ